MACWAAKPPRLYSKTWTSHLDARPKLGKNIARKMLTRIGCTRKPKIAPPLSAHPKLEFVMFELGPGSKRTSKSFEFSHKALFAWVPFFLSADPSIRPKALQENDTLSTRLLGIKPYRTRNNTRKEAYQQWTLHKY